ncbi:hypothetical protein COT87_02075 [Candidatus Collierbacteria bacterium CG10_big_fil_rev_8_21_14_0_10_44_9]|uniref:O-antigen ligase-related domain-containing protein n=1 Tax=Candidatus Collierbacteria bacterium CG10_big_fil_rev_8_21_14_0_10_44_9 TaxID=1974535 RepID=A0A2H0VIP2_9BACT|nr:MAG: hypothetical protein COT87_02075 [Candidatus Collierbacteria bacterium CG10_big_fil_rev_8_21_14_0_10_44_9]
MGKIEGFSFLLVSLIIFFSATQLGLHFWPLSALVYGVRIDYLSPTIYFLDLLIILYLAIKRLDLVDCKLNQKPTRSNLEGAIIPVLLVNLLFSANPLSTLSWSLHFLLYFLFLRTVLDRRPEQSSSRDAEGGRTVLYGTLRLALVLALLFQTIIALAQVSLGHSVGGPMYYLGERSVAVGSPAIALGTFIDHVVLRAYGTFSHPNVLAGWLAVTLLIILQLRKQRAVRISDLLRKSWPAAKMFNRTSTTSSETGSDLIGIISLVSITAFGVLLTQSRSAAFSLFGFIIPIYLLKSFKSRIIYFVIILSTIYYLPSTIIPIRSDLSSTQRLDLQGLSLKVISHFPVFGTGAQASISTYPALLQPKPRGLGGLQPDHNSFTLLLSWFGFFGVIALGSDLLRRRAQRVFSRTPKTNSETRSNPQSVFMTLLPLFPLFLLDHYFLTSPQGLFILLLYLTIALN